MNKLKVLKVLMVALVAFATLGCGSSSSNDFIGVNPNDPSETGGLLFQFHRGGVAAQSLPFDVNTELSGNVPAGTDHIGFSFFDSAYAGAYTGEWAGWSGQTFPFGAQDDLSVNITGVPTSVHFAVAIAYDANNIPLGALYSPEFNVVPGYGDLPIPLAGSKKYHAFEISGLELQVADVNLDITNTTGNVSLTNVVGALDVSATFGDGTTSVSADIPYSLVDVTGVNTTIATYLDGVFTGVSHGSYDFTATYGGASGTATVTVTDKTIVEADFADGSADVDLAAGANTDLLFDVTYADGTTATDIPFSTLSAMGYSLELDVWDDVVTLNATTGNVAMSGTAPAGDGDYVELYLGDDNVSYVWVGTPVP